jgi:hypothetical protein
MKPSDRTLTCPPARPPRSWVTNADTKTGFLATALTLLTSGLVRALTSRHASKAESACGPASRSPAPPLAQS